MFLPNVIKIACYNFELYRFKVGAFFLRHSVDKFWSDQEVLYDYNADLHVYAQTFLLPVIV